MFHMHHDGNKPGTERVMGGPAAVRMLTKGFLADATVEIEDSYDFD